MKVPEIFGENVFDLQVMQDKLPKEVFKSLKETIKYKVEYFTGMIVDTVNVNVIGVKL